ncbi:MAG: alpha/beta hydrolase [Pseudomonadota bacterium]
MRTASELQATTTYTHAIDHRGGAWRRFWLHLLLRVMSRRMIGLRPDTSRLRARQHRLDERIGQCDPAIRAAPVDCGGVPGEWLDVPGSDSKRVLLYFHGGAFMFRFPKTHAGLVGGWCRKLGARALMVDYRLAPEHRFPTAPDDCHAAYRWLLAQGYQAGDIVLAGDSAGGNLALATLHRIKAAGEPMPRCAVLLSPFADCTLSGESMLFNEAHDPMFTLPGMMTIRKLYMDPEDYLDPSASPLFADFTGLPPLLIQAGGIEMLRDDAVRVAARAHADGVDVKLEIWENMPHVFQSLHLLPQAAAANEAIVTYIGERTGWRVLR